MSTAKLKHVKDKASFPGESDKSMGVKIKPLSAVLCALGVYWVMMSQPVPAIKGAGRGAILNGKCPGQGRVGCKIRWEVKNTEKCSGRGKTLTGRVLIESLYGPGVGGHHGASIGFGGITHQWSQVKARIF